MPGRSQRGSALALASFNTRMPASPIEKPRLVTASTAARVKARRAWERSGACCERMKATFRTPCTTWWCLRRFAFACVVRPGPQRVAELPGSSAHRPMDAALDCGTHATPGTGRTAQVERMPSRSSSALRAALSIATACSSATASVRTIDHAR